MTAPFSTAQLDALNAVNGEAAAEIMRLRSELHAANMRLSDAQSELAQTLSMDNAAMDKMQTMIREQSQLIREACDQRDAAEQYAMELQRAAMKLDSVWNSFNAILIGRAMDGLRAALAKNQRGEAAASSAEGSTGTTTPAMILSRPSPTHSDDARTVLCPDCNGSGSSRVTVDGKCDTCRGSGQANGTNPHRHNQY